MKKALTTIAMTAALLATALSPTPTLGSGFCDGWEDGYCAGYRSVMGQISLCPITPPCPIPPLGCSFDDYRCGVAEGVVAGALAAR